MQKCIHSKQSAKFFIPSRFAPYRGLKGSMQYENINFTFFRYNGWSIISGTNEKLNYFKN